MGQKTSLPIFISPAGMAGLAHPLAERGLATSAGECGIIQMASQVSRVPLSALILQVSTNASAPLAEIINSRTSTTQPFFMQLYVDRNRSKTEKLLGVINDLGLKAIFVTVDAAAPGKREADERSRAEVEVVSSLALTCGCPVSRSSPSLPDLYCPPHPDPIFTRLRVLAPLTLGIRDIRW